MRDISIVIPVFNEEESLPKLYNAIMSIVNKNEYQYELVFIDDGSRDLSVEVLKGIKKNDENIKIITLRKNFGKAVALQTGFQHVSGKYVITMDADLQDDPNEIPRMIEELEKGFDVVSGWKFNRLDPLEKRLPSKLFNKVTSILSGVKLHDFNCGFKAYRLEVVKSIDVYGELHRYIPVLAHRKGFRITEIKVNHLKREFGKSKYGFERYLRGLFDSLSTSFLLKYYDRPMYFFGKLGLLSFILGGGICTYLTVEWFCGTTIGDRPLLLLGILLIILGAQFISTGFIGDMILDATYRSRYTEAHVKEIIN